MSEFDEPAKAVREVAKLGTKALDSGDKLGGFLSNVFGIPLENALGIMGDRIEFVRWERQTRMIDKVNEYKEDKGLTRVRPIHPKFAIPMIENASLEEDNDLQDIWCRLIVNGLDPNFDSEIRYAFIEIIKTLTPLDVKILKYMYDSNIEIYSDFEGLSIGANYRNHMIKNHAGRNIVYIKEDLSETLDEIEASLDNLLRVRCLKDMVFKKCTAKKGELGDPIDAPSLFFSDFFLTQLGIIFVEACIN